MTACNVVGDSVRSTWWTISIVRPAIEIDLNQPSQRVIRVLERGCLRGYPISWYGNGPEFISVTLASWTEEHGIALGLLP
ncbi:hypothetical protein HJA72_004185 [Vibrio fluvialis]|nr:hypothetical protein [Vibrio fluvialis]